MCMIENPPQEYNKKPKNLSLWYSGSITIPVLTCNNPHVIRKVLDLTSRSSDWREIPAAGTEETPNREGACRSTTNIFLCGTIEEITSIAAQRIQVKTHQIDPAKDDSSSKGLLTGTKARWNNIVQQGSTLSCHWASTRVTKIGWFFSKIAENWWNRTGPNLKITKNTVHHFKISEKDKISKIYIKTRSNSKVTTEEIFVKLGHLG
jgi:hypothetical protein